MIKFKNVTKTYLHTVLDRVTLDFDEGRINALMGESGKGKTTVLRLIAGLESADSGEIAVHGKVAYLFQEPRLFPALSALENVRLVTAGGKTADAEKWLALCKARHLADKMPSEMSGGERQRVAIARMLAFGGDIFAMDEPFSALDADTRNEIVNNILPCLVGKTVIMVTHSEKDALLADKIIKL